MQSGLVNSATESLTRLQKEIEADELAFSRTFGIVPPFPRLADVWTKIINRGQRRVFHAL